MGKKFALRKARVRSKRAATIGDDESCKSPGDRQQNAFGQGLGDDLAPGGSNGHAQGGLAAAGDRANEQEVGDVGAGDEQHQAADRQQNLQAATVLFFHDRDTGTGGHHIDDLLGQVMDDFGHPVGGVAGVVLHPLAQESGEARRHSRGGGSRPQPTDYAQPRGDWLTQQRTVAIDQWLLLHGNPDIGRIALQSFAEKSGGRDTDDRERTAFHNESSSNHRGVGSVDGLPGAMTENHNGRRAWFVIFGSNDTATECANAQRMEIIAGHVFGAQRPGGRLNALAANAQSVTAGLEGGDFLEFWNL